MKTKYLDFLNEEVDYDKIISSNGKYMIFKSMFDKNLDLSGFSSTKYPLIEEITIDNAIILNAEVVDFSLFKNLKKMSFKNCVFDENIIEIESSSLKSLFFDGCVHDKLIFNFNIQNCNNLIKLVVRNTNINTINSLEKLTNLKVLDLYNCAMFDMPTLNNLLKLDTLLLQKNLLREIPEIDKCTQLEKIDISNNINIKSLPSLATNTKLQILNCELCNLTKIPDLTYNVDLEELDLYANEIQETPQLDNILPNLKNLNIKSNNLITFNGIHNTIIRIFINYSDELNISNQNKMNRIEYSWFLDRMQINKPIDNYCHELFKHCAKIGATFDNVYNILWDADFLKSLDSMEVEEHEVKYLRYLQSLKRFSEHELDLFNFDF